MHSTADKITLLNTYVGHNKQRSAQANFLVLSLIEQRQQLHGDVTIAEYINEAEHGEGTEYWERFITPEQLVDDFDLYIQELNDAHIQDLPKPTPSELHHDKFDPQCEVDEDAGYCGDS